MRHITAKHQGRHITCVFRVGSAVGVKVRFTTRKVNSIAIIAFMNMKSKKVSVSTWQTVYVGNHQNAVCLLIKFYNTFDVGGNDIAVYDGYCLRFIKFTLHIITRLQYMLFYMLLRFFGYKAVYAGNLVIISHTDYSNCRYVIPD